MGYILFEDVEVLSWKIAHGNFFVMCGGYILRHNFQRNFSNSDIQFHTPSFEMLGLIISENEPFLRAFSGMH